MTTTPKAKRKLAKKQIVVGSATDDKKSGARKVIRDQGERARVNPPLSTWATEQIERLEVARSWARQRLGQIRMN